MDAQPHGKSVFAAEGSAGPLGEGAWAAPDAGIVVPPADDFPGNETTFGRIAVDGSRTGTLQFQGDSDWLRVRLEAGRTYVVTVLGAYHEAGTLPYITTYMRDPEGVFRLNHPQSTSVAFTFRASQTADYFVEVFDPEPGIHPLGTYRVAVDEAPVRFNDFDSNRAADILAQGGGTVVEWFMANGAYDGGRVVGSELPPGWNVVGTGAINADAFADIVLQGGNTVVAWLMDGAGHYADGRVLTILEDGTRVAGTGDFDGDGYTDLLFQGNGTVHQLSGVERRRTTLATNLPAGWEVVGVGDVNGDGTSDIILQNGSTVVEWLYANGVVQSGRVLTSSLPFGWQVSQVGDFNGDRTDDILIQGGNYVVDWLMQNGTVVGGHVVSGTLPAGWSVRGTGDYNDDGTDDLSLQGGGTIVNWLMSDGQYAAGNVIATGLPGWSVVGKT